jgi:hypothetical protein
MKTYGRVEVYVHVYFLSALDENGQAVSRSCNISPGERASDSHWIDWMGPRASMDAVENNLLPLPGIKPRFLDLSARSFIAVPAELSTKIRKHSI